MDTDRQPSKPRFSLVAGPNGAGKTTIARSWLLEHLAVEHFLNADTIAAGLSAFAPWQAMEPAAAALLRELDRLVQRRVSFAVETTLASRTYAARLVGQLGNYHRHLLFLHLSSSDLAVQRVHRRVACGGHRIPDQVIRRRYDRGLRNFFSLYLNRVDSWQFLENSGAWPRLIASCEDGKLMVVNELEWAALRKQYADD